MRPLAWVIGAAGVAVWVFGVLRYAAGATVLGAVLVVVGCVTMVVGYSLRERSWVTFWTGLVDGVATFFTQGP